jgi:hypothetical protein
VTGHWWAHKDAKRLIARAYSAAARGATDDELGHLRASCMVLLTGPLELDPDDAQALRHLLTWLDGARDPVS